MEGIGNPTYQIGNQSGSYHGLCHSPFCKAGCNIPVRMNGAEDSDIWDAIQGNTVLGGPMQNFFGSRKPDRGLLAEKIIGMTTWICTRSVAAATEQ